LPYIVNRSSEPPRGDVFVELLNQARSLSALNPRPGPGYSKTPAPGDSFVAGQPLCGVEKNRNPLVLADIGKADKSDFLRRSLCVGEDRG
jgi:hypothetical protein